LRSLSDHYAIVLTASEEDWGPRPSRMLKCWRDESGYHLFVRDKWKSLRVNGWGGYELREKLKLIRRHWKTGIQLMLITCLVESKIRKTG
jgi:hypothetical protein